MPLVICRGSMLVICFLLSLPRGDIDPENPQHEQSARRLFDEMLQALEDVSVHIVVVWV